MNEHIPTPHIEAREGDFARTVLMPGDPLRSAFIAENFLTDPVLVNNVRGVQGYTGTWQGKRVSVMASGMGMPSIGIYSYELFNFYGVEQIIRVGSSGSLADGLKLGDIVAGMAACTDSNYARQFSSCGVTLSACCDYDLLCRAVQAGEAIGKHLVVGQIYSSDVFYHEQGNTVNEELRKMGVLAVEMESYALYLNAARAGKKALCLTTVSDEIFTGKALSADDRRTTFTDMMKIALAIA